LPSGPILSGLSRTTIINNVHYFQVPIASIIRIWPAASKWKAFGLQLQPVGTAQPLSQLLKPVLGSPIKGFVVPGAVGTAVAIKIPVIGDQVFDVFPWFAFRLVDLPLRDCLIR
jgi:hypothetical protein